MNEAIPFQFTVVKKSFTLTPYVVEVIEQKKRQMREPNASAALRAIVVEWAEMKRKEQEDALSQ